MEKKESTKLNNLLCQLVQDTRDDVRPLIFEDMLEITKLFEDHLNTQPQAEEKSTFEDGVDFKEEVIKMKHKFEDTPEQKKDWEEDFRGFLDFVIEDDSNKKEVVEKVKQLLSEREREGYEKGKDYQASLGRACYGTSFEKLKKGIIEDKSPLAPEKGIDWSGPMSPMRR